MIGYLLQLVVWWVLCNFVFSVHSLWVKAVTVWRASEAMLKEPPGANALPLKLLKVTT